LPPFDCQIQILVQLQSAGIWIEGWFKYDKGITNLFDWFFPT